MQVQTECKLTEEMGDMLVAFNGVRAPSSLADAFSARGIADGDVQRQAVGTTVVRDEIEKTRSKVRQFALADAAYREQRAG
jgi:hypothetical protein